MLKSLSSELLIKSHQSYRYILIYTLSFVDCANTGCPKITFTTLIINNFQTKNHIVKQNTYLKSANLHNFFDTKFNVIGLSNLSQIAFIFWTHNFQYHTLNQLIPRVHKFKLFTANRSFPFFTHHCIHNKVEHQ